MNENSQTNGRAPRRQRGLTLIELVVVLTILVALGGVLVPVIGNALTRSHVATCATNFPEVTKLMIAANSTLGTYGSGWTTGVFVTGAAAGGDAAVNTVLNPAGVTDSLNVDTLTDDQKEALADIGIGAVCDHSDTSIDEFDVTFNSGIEDNCVALVDAAGDAVVADVHVLELTQDQWEGINLPDPTTIGGAGSAYIWLGLDKTWTLLGTLTPEPPVHFGDTEGALPNEVYSRFGGIFLIDDDATADNSNATARFTRVSYNITGDDAFETADNHIGIHWQEVHGSGI